MLDLSDLSIAFLAGTLGQGGAERQLYYMIRTLKAKGTTVRLLSLTQGEFWEQPIRELGVPVEYVGASRSRAARLGAITNSVRRHRPDLLQSQHFFTNPYSTAAGMLLRIPTIGASRNSLRDEMRACGSALGNLSLRLPRFLAINSRASITAAMELGVAAERLHFLPNVVDCQHFTPNLMRHKEQLEILTIGRLVTQKRTDRFLRVIARLKDVTQVPFKAWVVGDGPLRSDLQVEAARLGLEPGTVEFTGVLGDVAERLRMADIFVLTSGWEGTPNVILEAMASGVPVIATPVGDVPDMIAHGYSGILVNPDQEDELLDGLAELIRDPVRRNQMGQAGRSFIEAHHNLSQLPHYLATLYSRVLGVEVSS